MSLIASVCVCVVFGVCAPVQHDLFPLRDQSSGPSRPFHPDVDPNRHDAVYAMSLQAMTSAAYAQYFSSGANQRRASVFYRCIKAAKATTNVMHVGEPKPFVCTTTNHAWACVGCLV